MTIKQKREKLTKELLKVKNEGIRTFINKSDDFAYGIMTDGINIIYAQLSDCGIGFTTLFVYVPNYTTGDKCSTLERGNEYKELSKEVFFKSVRNGKAFAWKIKATLYRNFEQYFNDKKKKNYIEL